MAYLGSLAAALFATWLALAIVLVVARPKGSSLQEALRLLPDTLRLLHGLATDASLPRGVRVRLWLLFAYLAVPFDLIPDFIPESATRMTRSSCASCCVRSYAAPARPPFADIGPAH